MKGKQCLTNLMTFCDEMIGLVDDGRAVNVVFLTFSKAFDTISKNIWSSFFGLIKHNLGKRTVRWI